MEKPHRFRTFAVLAAVSVLAFQGSVQAYGDKGQMYPFPVLLQENSQRAIIFHGNGREVLILGTEFSAEQAVPVLEFIPFPSEPSIQTAKGDPFAVVARLLAGKQIEYMGFSKGGADAEEASMSPVELRYSGMIGVHDVAIIRIEDADSFAAWVQDFFKEKGFDYRPEKAVAIAREYLAKGIHYFVFDYLPLEQGDTLVEPLVYRFESEKLYYPLKTSNLVGESGRITLMLFLPGSLGLMEDRSEWISLGQAFGTAGELNLSSSSKIYPSELEEVLSGAAAIFGNVPVYGQAIRFDGYYAFKDDLLLDVSHIAPFANKNIEYMPDYGSWSLGTPLGEYAFVEPFTDDELRDAAAAYRSGNHAWYFDLLLVQELQAKGYLSGSEIR